MVPRETTIEGGRHERDDAPGPPGDPTPTPPQGGARKGEIGREAPEHLCSEPLLGEGLGWGLRPRRSRAEKRQPDGGAGDVFGQRPPRGSPFSGKSGEYAGGM